MSNNTTFAVIAIVAVLAVVGVVVVTTATLTFQLQQAEARGCPIGTPAPNASKIRCFRG